MDCANGTLVAGSLLSIGKLGSKEKTVDVQEILLFSQLYANFKAGDVDKFTSPRGWLKHYEDALLHTQWTLVEGDDYKERPEGATGISLEKLLEDYLLKRLTRAEAEHIRALFKRMAGLTDTQAAARVLYHHALKVPDDGVGASTFALQVNVLESPVQLASLFVTFSTRQTLEQLPFAQTFAGRHIVGDIQAWFSRRAWDADKYPPVRKSIRDFLNGKQGSLIVPIPCEVPHGVDSL